MHPGYGKNRTIDWLLSQRKYCILNGVTGESLSAALYLACSVTKSSVEIIPALASQQSQGYGEKGKNIEFHEH